MSDPGDELVYWSAMQYACQRCHAAIWFYLEDGCEGPRQGDYSKGNWLTPSGREIVPVPFVATICPDCGEAMSHVNFRGDRYFDPMLPAEQVPDDARRFLYPETLVFSHDTCGVAAPSRMDILRGIRLRRTPAWPGPATAPAHGRSSGAVESTGTADSTGEIHDGH